MLAMADFEWQGGCIHAKEQLSKFRLNTLSTADFECAGFECAGRCTCGSRLEVREDELPNRCFKVDCIVAKQASVVSACTAVVKCLHCCS